MSTTVQDLITSSLGMIGIADPGFAPAASELSHGQAQLNLLIGSWSAAGVFIPQSVKESLALTGVSSYTIGSGATWDTARPLKILAAACVVSGFHQPQEIVTAAQWVAVRDKTRSGKFSRYLFCDMNYPISTVSLTPTPATGGSIELHSLKALSAYANLSDAIDLPPGYLLALQSALAQLIAPHYGRAVPEATLTMAQTAQAAIAGLNQQVLGAPVPVEAPQA